MNIVVCAKQVIDVSEMKVDSATKKPILQGVPQKISDIDKNEMEEAIKIKDKHGGKITVVTVGHADAKERIKELLAMGADEGILVSHPEKYDYHVVSSLLSEAIKKIGEYDIIFCGRQAADWDGGQVGSGVAEILGLPSITLAKKIEVTDGKARVERVIPDGYEVVEVPIPALITVSSEIGEPRYPTIRGIMAAKKKEPTIWKPADIGIEPSQVGTAGRHIKLVKLFQPVREGKCEIIGGETPEEMAVNLADKLREAKVL